MRITVLISGGAVSPLIPIAEKLILHCRKWIEPPSHHRRLPKPIHSRCDNRQNRSAITKSLLLYLGSEIRAYTCLTSKRSADMLRLVLSSGVELTM